MNEQEEVIETNLEPSRPQMGIVDEKPIPKLLNKQIDDANETLFNLQQKLQDEITESAMELMTLMGITPDQGWFLDVENRRFVKVGQIEE